MKRLNLLNIDLNLLVAFDALVVEGSVSRAATRIGVSQPAMSRSLRQLRDMFGDALFKRTSQGMIPTPRALELARLLRPSLEHIAGTLSHNFMFDPARVERRFVLAMPDMAAMVMLPPLVRHLNATAPGIDLKVISAGNRESLVKVENGQAEFALGVYEHLAPGVRSANLQPLREICIADRDNPRLADGRLDLDRFLAFSHVAVWMNDDHGTPVDTTLETLGLRRRIAVSTPYFLSVPQLVIGTSMIGVIGEDLLDMLPERDAVARYPLPVPLDPVMSKLIWHARWDGDPGHEWFRELVTRRGRYDRIE